MDYLGLYARTSVSVLLRIDDARRQLLEPYATLDVTELTWSLLERALVVRPLPFVRRVIFIATPHG